MIDEEGPKPGGKGTADRDDTTDPKGQSLYPQRERQPPTASTGGFGLNNAIMNVGRARTETWVQTNITKAYEALEGRRTAEIRAIQVGRDLVEEYERTYAFHANIDKVRDKIQDEYDRDERNVRTADALEAFAAFILSLPADELRALAELGLVLPARYALSR